MDALHPRLLVDDFAACARFYERALDALLDIRPARMLPEAGYASWDLAGGTLLSLFGRTTLAAAVDIAGPPNSQIVNSDSAMLVLRVENVDTAWERLSALGASPVTEPRDRPEWGPGLRTAHLRDPAGNLLELQSY